MSAAALLTGWADASRAMVTYPGISADSRAWYAAEAARITSMVERHDVRSMAEALERLAQTHDRAALSYEYQFPHDGLRSEAAAKAAASRTAAENLLTQREAA